MKVNRPGSPLSSGAESVEPLDAKELQNALKTERFSAALAQLEAQAAGSTGGTSSPVRAALAQIADASNLSSSEGAAAAVRESARFMVRTRLNDKFRESEQGSTLVERLSEFVASDPLLHSKLLGILQKVKTA
jgi:hypothetical protein